VTKAAKDRSINNCLIVAFRPGKERYFREAKGDNYLLNETKCGPGIDHLESDGYDNRESTASGRSAGS